MPRKPPKWVERITDMEMAEFQVLTKEELKAKREPWMNGRSGVYVLWRGEDIVYVGKSVDMPSRIRQHLTSRNFVKDPFTACTFLDHDPHDMGVMEAIYIARLRPSYNVEGKTDE